MPLSLPPHPHTHTPSPQGELARLAPAAFSAYADACSQRVLAALMHCPRCGAAIECLPPDPAELAGLRPTGVPEFDRTARLGDPRGVAGPDGTPLSQEARLHRALHRFRCVCGTDFCSSCVEFPYHLGQSCAHARWIASAPRCRYCQEPVGKFCESPTPLAPREGMTVREIQNAIDAVGLDRTWVVEKGELLAVAALAAGICSALECRRKGRAACTRLLRCGHYCGGLRGERECPPCLQEPCSLGAKDASAGGEGGGLCVVCLDPLTAAPCLRLQCGHMLHLACAQVGPRGGEGAPLHGMVDKYPNIYVWVNIAS